MFGLPLLRLGQESFDVTDSDGPIELESFAVKFARMGAYIPEDSGKRQLLAHRLEGLTESPRTGELDIEVSIDSEWASRLTLGGPLAPTSVENSISEFDHPREGGGGRFCPGFAPVRAAKVMSVTRA